MKLDKIVNDVDVSGIDKKDINIAKIIPNAVMMDILGNKLYKNKIDSTAREIISNAKDASIEAGVTTPIEIHIPTLLEPWYGVKDYGIGMSEDTIVEVFANYGASTKRNSNTLIGGFGIGAKVAGVYSGQFSVTSIKDGKKCIYQFFKNEEGMPANTCLYSGDTEEPNGTEVKIAANQASDFRQFQEATEKYCQWIDYAVKCNQNLNLTRPSLEVKEPNFGITSIGQSRIIIIVGGIPYPIDISSYRLGNSIYLYEDIKGIKSNRIIFFANIGDIDLIASREEVEYTPKTEAYIKKVGQEIDKWYKDYLKDKTSFWLHQNTKDWEHIRRDYFSYGFDIVHKDRNKWVTASKAKVFQKYIEIKDLKNTDIIFGVAAKKLDETYYEKTVAFVDENDVAALIKLGATKSQIYKFDKLPKKVPAKKKLYTVYKPVETVDSYGRKRVTFKKVKTNDLEHPKTLKIRDWDLGNHQKKSIIEQIYNDEKYNILVVNDGVSELDAHMKAKLKECNDISYCDIADRLEKLGFIQILNRPKDDGKNWMRKLFGLLKNESVNYSNSFPLLANYSKYCNMDAKTKKHAIGYVEWVLKEEKPDLSNPNIKLLR